MIYTSRIDRHETGMLKGRAEGTDEDRTGGLDEEKKSILKLLEKNLELFRKKFILVSIKMNYLTKTLSLLL